MQCCIDVRYLEACGATAGCLLTKATNRLLFNKNDRTAHVCMCYIVSNVVDLCFKLSFAFCSTLQEVNTIPCLQLISN